MGERDPFMHPLLGFQAGNNASNGQAPQHWLNQDVKLRNGGRRLEATIPSTFADHAGIDRDDPPEITVYFDAHTGLVMFDLMGHFGGDTQ